MDPISIDELLALTAQNRSSREPLKNRLKEFAGGDSQRIKDLKSRCDYFIMMHKNEQDCRIIKDTVEEVIKELS